jgi:histone H3/H4
MMTTTQQKAHADSTGFLELLNSFNAATRQGLASDATLTSLYDLNQQLGTQRKLLSIDSNISIITGSDIGTIAPTAGTIGLVLSNNQDQPVSLASVTLASNQKPLIIDRVQPSALIIGTLGSTSEIIAIDNLDDAVTLAQYLINDNVTLIVSLDSLLFNNTVKHFAEAYPVTIFTTLDQKDKVCQPFKGANVKAVITGARTVLEHLEYGELSYREILTLDDTAILDLQAEIWGEPEPLANDPSKPTPYPINAFNGLLQNVVKAIAHYSQVPDAMAGQCVLGALAHMGQRFIDAPMGHGHMPTSLILITEGESGSGKTQAMGLTHFKIKEHERQQYTNYLDDITTWESDKAALKGKEQVTFIEDNPKPKNPKNLFDDATIEPILDRFISGEMNNASWTTDEAGQFFNGHTMTGDTAGSALSALTKLWSDGEVSRLRSQKSAYATPQTDAHNVRMTLLLQGQRVVLEQALTDPLMNGQGFLARALIACPPDLRGKRIWDNPQRRNDSPYDNPDLIEYWSRCHALLDPLPASQPNDSTGTPQRIKMQWANQQAEQAFYEHMQAIENRQANGQTLEYLKAYASRMAENASRIAALMAFFDERKTITTDDITRAFMLVEYSTAERLRYLDATPTGEQNDSEKLSGWLVDKARGKKPPILNKSFVSQNAPNALRGKKLNSLLDDLESMRHVRLESEGRRRLVCINPKLINK